MRIHPPPLSIGDIEGFAPEKDIFGRKSWGEGLANLMASLEEPTVVAVDGQWGSGKTTFLRMWTGLLRQRGFPVIYFDAFENDHAEDAFSAIAGQIISLLQSLQKADDPKAKAFINRAIGAGKIVARSALKVGVKAATAGALEAADFGDLAKAISSETAALEDKYLGELLTKQTERKATIDAFRQALGELPPLLAAAGSAVGDGAAAKPLVFIIDELDRCRPVFALQLLEKMKHFFAVPNVHFVLGTHMGQLQNSVEAAYGAKINAAVYLQKFIHLTFPLHDKVPMHEGTPADVYVSLLRSQLGFASQDREVLDDAVHFIQAYARYAAPSLRDLERVMSNLALALAYTTPNHLRPGPLVAGLCILKVVQPGLYVRAKRGTLTFSDATGVLGLHEIGREDTGGYQDWEIKLWRFCIDPDVDEEIISTYSSGLGRRHIRDRTVLLPLVANEIVDRLTPNE